MANSQPIPQGFQGNLKMKHWQRGISFVGLLFVAAVVVCAGILIAKVAPTLIEYQAITKAADKSKYGSTDAEVRAIFDKAAAIDGIASISGKDLEVSKTGDGTVVAFAYTREIHMAGPAFLVLKYNGSSK